MTPGEVLSQEDAWETVPSFELEEASRNQLHAFRDSLSRASNECYRIFAEDLFDLELYDDSSRPNKPLNEVMASDIKSQLAETGNEFYTTDEFDWLSEAELNQFKVLRTARAETSAHGVFFGLMVNDRDGKSLPIAVKPCIEKPKKAYLDWLNNGLISRTGRKHFTPVGFIFDSEAAYSLTAIQKGVETLDNTDWRMALLDIKDSRNEMNREQLREVGRVMAGIHEERIFHGDPQFKNIAVDATGDTFFIDWESAQFYGSHAEDRILIDKAAHDLEVLFYSIAAPVNRNGVGLLSSYDRALQWERFNEFILTPYLETRLTQNDDARNIEIVGAVEDSIKEYILKDFTLGSIKRFTQKQAA